MMSDTIGLSDLAQKITLATPIPVFAIHEGLVVFQNQASIDLFDAVYKRPVVVCLDIPGMIRWLDQEISGVGIPLAGEHYGFRTRFGVVDYSITKQWIDSNVEGIQVLLIFLNFAQVQENFIDEYNNIKSRYNSLTNSLSDLVWIMDSNLHISWLSKPGIQALGFDPTLDGVRDLLQLIELDCKIILKDRLTPHGFLAMVQAGGGRAQIEISIWSARGGFSWMEISAFLQKNSANDSIEYLCIVKDISDRRKVQAQLGRSEEKFSRILQSLPVPILVMLHDWSIESINAKFKEVFGWVESDIPHMENWWERTFPDSIYRSSQREKFMEMVGNAALHNIEGEPVVVRGRCADGQERVFECRFIYLPGLGLWAFNDITELRNNEERLKVYATRDELTGVYNRRSGIALLERAINSATVNHRPLSISFLDINNLKTTNDRYGHAAGDKLITTVAETIASYIRRSDSLFRIGGDEFVAILPDCNAEQAQEIMNKILLELELNKENLPFVASFSFGIEQFTQGQGTGELLALADKTMYARKRKYHRDNREEEAKW